MSSFYGEDLLTPVSSPKCRKLKEVHRLGVFENSVLRKIMIFGPKKEEVREDWKKSLRSNFTIVLLAKQDVVDKTKNNGMG
jgi:hypothetical protein